MVDSGLLSLAPIIAASRAWICIRPLTYENKAEADYLRAVFSPRGGLENTVFALMDPNATRHLVAPGRGPYMVWADCFEKPQSMIDGMAALAKQFKPLTPPNTLPTVESVRLAMNTAACDNRPLAILYAKADTAALSKKVGALAWEDAMLGQLVYAETRTEADLKKVSGFDGKEGVVFVQPDEFGVEGKMIGFVPISAGTDEMRKAMAKAVAAYKPIDQSDHRGHLGRGVRKGVRWKPAIAVEDRQADQATKNLWGG